MDARPDETDQLRAMLAEVEAQRARVEAEIDVDPVLLLGSWGVAQLVGFGAIWLTSGEGRILPLSVWWGVAVYVVLVVAAVVTTIVHTTRATRGLRGRSALVGAMHGWSWTIGFVAMGLVLGGVMAAGLGNEIYQLLWPALTGLVIGLQYMAAGCIWRDPTEFGLGAWVVLAASVSTFAGVPGNYLFMALLSGGGFLLAAAFFAVRHRRAGRAVPA